MYATASSAERRSGSETISSSGVPARFRSMPDMPGKVLVQRLARVLLEVRARDADRLRRAVLEHDLDAAVCDDRQLVLADLIALRQVGIEVVLAREHRAARDRAARREAELDRHAHGLGVEHGQHARITEIDEVRLRCSVRRRSASRRPRRSCSPSRVARGSRGRSRFPNSSRRASGVRLGHAAVPVRDALIVMRGLEQRSFREAAARSSCKPTGRPPHEAARQRHRGQAREVRADRVDVVQVHRRSGCSSCAPMPNAGEGDVGPATTSTSRNARAKSSLISLRTFCACR